MKSYQTLPMINKYFMNDPIKKLMTTALILVISIFCATVNAKTDGKKVILLDEIPVSTSCGNIAYAVALKLRAINETDTSKIIVGIIRCPDSYGPNVFAKSAKFTVELSTDTTALKEYTVYNLYRNLGKPTFLITKIGRN